MLKYALAKTVIYDRQKYPPIAITGELEHVSFLVIFFCLESHLGGMAQVMVTAYFRALVQYKYELSKLSLTQAT